MIWLKTELVWKYGKKAYEWSHWVFAQSNEGCMVCRTDSRGPLNASRASAVFPDLNDKTAQDLPTLVAHRVGRHAVVSQAGPLVSLLIQISKRTKDIIPSGTVGESIIEMLVFRNGFCSSLLYSEADISACKVSRPFVSQLRWLCVTVAEHTV